MYLKLTLLLIFLEVVFVLSGENDPDQSISNQSTSVSTSIANPSSPNQSDILPLIIIKVGLTPLNPIQFSTHEFVRGTHNSKPSCISAPSRDNVRSVVVPKYKRVWNYAQGTKILNGTTEFTTSAALSTTEKQFYLCPVKNVGLEEEETNISTKFAKVDDEYCVYPIKFGPKDPLRCPQEPKPFVSNIYSMMKGPDLLTIGCGENKLGKMHWFVYKTCMTKKPIENDKILEFDFSNTKVNFITHRTHFEVYKLCYDDVSNDILYTKHRIMSPKLLNDDKLENERKTEYDMSTEGYQIFDSHFDTIKKQYSELKDSSSYRIQKLVPPGDFPFSLWRKPTYHYLNVKLMQKDHVKLWDHITERIRKKSIELEKQFIISTGAFIISEKNEVFIEGELKTPDTWIKIVYDLGSKPGKDGKMSNEALAIIMVDNMENTYIEDFYRDSCEENLCEGAFDNGLYSGVSKFVKCCPVTNEIDKYFQLEEKLSITGILDAKFLFENS